MVVVDWGTVVVFLSVGQWLFRVVSEVRHMLLILIVRVVSFMGHGVLVVAVEATMVHGAVIEVLRVVVSIVVTVLHLVVGVVVVSVVMLINMLWGVMMVIKRQIVVHIGMLSVVMTIHVLDVVVTVVLLVVHVLVVHSLVVDDGLVVLNDMVNHLVDNWLVMHNLVDEVLTLGHFGVGFGLVMGLFTRVEVGSVVLVDIVRWSVMD